MEMAVSQTINILDIDSGPLGSWQNLQWETVSSSSWNAPPKPLTHLFFFELGGQSGNKRKKNEHSCNTNTPKTDLKKKESTLNLVLLSGTLASGDALLSLLPW